MQNILPDLTHAQWRLFFAGLYPVEFRDFFLGDLFCSLTYALGVSRKTAIVDPVNANTDGLEHRALLLPLLPVLVRSASV